MKKRKFKPGDSVIAFCLYFSDEGDCEGVKHLAVEEYLPSGLVLCTDEDGDEYELKESALTKN